MDDGWCSHRCRRCRPDRVALARFVGGDRCSDPYHTDGGRPPTSFSSRPPRYCAARRDEGEDRGDPRVACRRWDQVPRTPYETGGGTSDRKSTRLNSSHVAISYAVFCLKK